jgi:hypothetical protein
MINVVVLFPGRILSGRRLGRSRVVAIKRLLFFLISLLVVNLIIIIVPNHLPSVGQYVFCTAFHDG